MNTKSFLLMTLIIASCSECISKGVRFGGGGRHGSGGKSGGSRTNGSKNNSPSSPSSQATNANSQYGWSSQPSGISQPSNSNNQKSSAPIGPPPAYPGLQSQPVFHENKPPPYSPSSNFPPPIYSQQSNLFTANNKQQNPSYGNTFGDKGLASNTFISNKFYKMPPSLGISGLLTNALFFGSGLHILNRRKWTDDDDLKWRATTKAPYFENKVPGSEVILPASAVVGAATAFGLASLLPLNVPANKPLMYCSNSTSDIAQTQINVNGKVYQCLNETFFSKKFSCLESNLIVSDDELKIMQCDSVDNIFCTNGTLLSRIDIFCNSTMLMNTTANIKEITILNCYEGKLLDKFSSFIPTSTPQPINEKHLSFAARTHLFFLKLIGKDEIFEKAKITHSILEDRWIPEALTLPPPPSDVLKAANFQTIANENSTSA